MLHVIQLASQLDQGFKWLEINSSGQLVRERIFQDYAALEQFEDVKHISILLPGELTALHRVALPKVAASDLKVAMRYAVEEQLCDDIEDLHFVKGRYDGKTAHMAIVAKALMADICERLKPYGLNITCMIPDCLALPYQAGNWTLVQQADRWLVRQGEQLGFCVSQDHFPLVWKTLSQQLQGDQKPKQLQVYAAREASLERQLAELQGVDQVWHESPCTYDVAALTAPGVFNLLTPPYRLITRMPRSKRRWLNLAATVLGCFSLSLLADFSASFYLQHQSHQVQAKLHRLLQSAEMSAVANANASQALQQQLAKYDQLEKANGFLTAARGIGSALFKTALWEHWMIQSLQFSKQTMTVALLPREAHPIPLQALVANLEQQGWQVSQKALKNSGYQLTLSRGEQ